MFNNYKINKLNKLIKSKNISKNEQYKILSGLKFLNKINNKIQRAINGNIKKLLRLQLGIRDLLI